MSIRLVSTSLPDLLPMRTRSPGPHASVIIGDLCTRLGLYDKRDADAFPVTRAQLGCALEDTLAARFVQDDPARYQRGSELTRDGIHVTPDFWDVGDPRTQPESPLYDPRVYPIVTRECKLTWMSAKVMEGVGGEEVDPRSGRRTVVEGERLWRYWRQLEAQCFALVGPDPDPDLLVLGQLTVVFIQGDYKLSDIPGPTWEREYTYTELENTWRMLVGHLAVMRSEGFLFEGEGEEPGTDVRLE